MPGGGGGAGADGGGGSSAGGAGGVGAGGSCEPKSCAEGNCGTIDDGCGHQVNCGACFPNATCGADNVCGACAKFTCAAKGYHCGMLDDGCGGAEFCGDYQAFHVCDEDHVPATTCKCPLDHPYGRVCMDGYGAGVTPSGCIQNPLEPTSGWCCQS